MTGASSLRWDFVAQQAGLLLQAPGLERTPRDSGLVGLPAVLAVRPRRDPPTRDTQSPPQATFPQPRGVGGAEGPPLGTGVTESL